jgi:hypothetical protein
MRGDRSTVMGSPGKVKRERESEVAKGSPKRGMGEPAPRLI